MRSVDLNLLVALDALLDERNVSRAAARLGMSQPALSHALARLRDVIGDPLFVRAKGGIVPTRRAEEVRESVKDILARAEEVLRAPDFDPARAQGRFSIATTDYMALAYVIPLIARLRKSAPGLSVALASLPPPEAATAIDRGDYDLVITAPELAIRSSEQLSLGQDRYVGLARPGHSLFAGRISAATLCEHAHVLVAPAASSSSGPMDEALDALGFKRRIAVTLPSFLLLAPLLAATDFVAAAPERLAMSFESKLIRIFELPLRLARIEIIATWHPRYSVDPRHRWIRDTLCRIASGAAG